MPRHIPCPCTSPSRRRRGGRRIHLIQAGWFANDFIERGFKEAAQAFCPSVRALFLDGRQPEIRAGIWFAADVFTSLSDNIQETFGLAPIEAMAAGLPVVVSDWNGYRDTVRHGVDGFAVPTLMPPPGLGTDLALRHDLDVDSYDFYIGAASQCVSVDVEKAADSYARLATDSELRRTMGAAGRRRAEERYDWRVVIAAYHELWNELAERRRAAGQIPSRSPNAPADPLRDDPFTLFEGYPTEIIGLDAVVSLAPGVDTGADAAARLAHVRRLHMNEFAARLLASGEDRKAALHHLAERGPCAVGDLLALFPGDRARLMHRTLGWLAKYGFVRIAEGVATSVPRRRS
ncbi:MAG: glycosyltransferase family 4 protein [Rhodoplanes sp.]